MNVKFYFKCINYQKLLRQTKPNPSETFDNKGKLVIKGYLFKAKRGPAFGTPKHEMRAYVISER